MGRIALLIGAIFVAGVMALPASQGEATGFTVTKTADTFDGVCDADCSLREAIWAANNSQGPHVIDIPGDGNVYVLTRPGGGEDLGQTGDLDINTEVEIFGDGNPLPIIEMSSTITDRIFHVHGGPVTLAGVTIRGGSSAQGGGIYNAATMTLGNSTVTANLATEGGGVYSTGSLTVNNSTITGNGAAMLGGGIYSSGPFVMVTSTVSANQASDPVYGGGGGLYLSGPTSHMGAVVVSNNIGAVYAGGIAYSVGTHTLDASTVSGNRNTSAAITGGGGINAFQTNLTVTNSIISANQTGTYGGGFSNQGSTVTIQGSSLYANRGGYGGAIQGVGSTTNVLNSTLSGNIATSYGGGVFNYAGDQINMYNSTLTGNSASVAGGGIYDSTDAEIYAGNTIIANSPSGGDCSGTIISTDPNLASDATCTFTGAGDLNSTVPLLGPLALNGGTTPSHALLDGSPAADAGSLVCLGVDQRGIARPQGLKCDIGAYEAPDSDGDGASNPADLDDDDDGKPDATDTCAILAEDYDGHQDSEGCPDPDNDEDGICDAGQTSISCFGSDSGKQCFDPAGTLPCPTIDCRNLGEDADAFKDGDGCPEPDNDNDSFPDVTDACPGADASAGPNGMFGAAQDLNHNGVRDGAEAALTTDDIMPLLMWEDKDGVLDTDGCHDSPGNDFDGDGLTDDTEVFTLATDPGHPDSDLDTRTDGADNCPNWPNTPQNLPPWTVPANDSDCDGWNLVREQHVGTDPTKQCNLTTAVHDEADRWPTDFNDSRITNLSDVVLIGPSYNLPIGTDPMKKRFDLNASGVVNLSDVVLIGSFYNKGCA